tara:strand:- start:1521 stop:2423 length:903 start_codon:yes stop_codon:yes gene_type:complete
MALRKDKVAAALQEMKGICSSPEDPASLPNTINQLADILGDLFDDIALPELPQIDSGEFGLPEDAPFDFPLGGGDMPPFDPLGGFEGGPPGGGEEFGPGGEDGGGGGPVGEQCNDEGSEHVTFLAKTAEEIPAGENGNPGYGLVNELVVVGTNQKQYDKCVEDLQKQYGPGSLLDMEEAETNLHHAIHAGELEAPDGPAFETEDEAVKHWRKRIKELKEEHNQAIADCEFEPSDDGPEETGNQLIAKNISCEKIEKDTTVVVSGRVNQRVCRDSVGNFLRSNPVAGTEDLYVMVESCGCD